jgi:hypothetical protein
MDMQLLDASSCCLTMARHPAATEAKLVANIVAGVLKVDWFPPLIGLISPLSWFFLPAVTIRSVSIHSFTLDRNNDRGHRRLVSMQDPQPW